MVVCFDCYLLNCLFCVMVVILFAWLLAGGLINSVALCICIGFCISSAV